MYVKANRDWLVIAYIPLRGKFVTQPLHLPDTRDNRRIAQQVKKALEDAQHTGKLERSSPSASRPRNASETFEQHRAQGNPTLGQYAAEWLAEKTQLPPAIALRLRVHDSRRTFSRTRSPSYRLPDRRGALTPSSIEIAAKNKRATKPTGPSRPSPVNMVIARLRTVFATAYRRGLVPRTRCGTSQISGRRRST